MTEMQSLALLIMVGFLTFIVCEIGKILNEINYKLYKMLKGN